MGLVAAWGIYGAFGARYVALGVFALYLKRIFNLSCVEFYFNHLPLRQVFDHV